MEIDELIRNGDILFDLGEFEQAFAYYHEAHMNKNFYSTSKLSECFGIAFIMNNTLCLDEINKREYLDNSIKLYNIAYDHTQDKSLLLKRCFFQSLYDYEDPWNGNPFCSDNIKFYLTLVEHNPQYKSSPFYRYTEIVWGNICDFVKFVDDESINSYIRMATCAKRARNLTTETPENAAEFMFCIEKANELGANYDISSLASPLKEDLYYTTGYYISFSNDRFRDMLDGKYKRGYIRGDNNHFDLDYKTDAIDLNKTHFEDYDYSKGYHDPDDYVTRHYDYNYYGDENDEPTEMDEWVMHEWEIDNIDDGR